MKMIYTSLDLKALPSTTLRINSLAALVLSLSKDLSALSFNKFRTSALAYAIFLSPALICPMAHAQHPIIGDKAPAFSLMDKDSVEHSLAEYRKKKVALYFYPKDDTWGCTKQACSIRDNFDDLADAGIVVLGVSKGSSKDKSRFAEKYHLPFMLLRATDDMLKQYGVKGSFWTFFMPKRRTFLINEDGIIVNIITDIDVKHHAQQILDGFAHVH